MIRGPSLMSDTADTDSLRAESIRSTFQMAPDQGTSSYGILGVNLSKVKLYAAWIVCVLVAAVAYAVYIDSRISRLEQDTKHQLQLLATPAVTDDTGCNEGCSRAITALSDQMDDYESKLRRLKTRIPTSTGGISSTELDAMAGDLRDELMNGLEEARRGRSALEAALQDSNRDVVDLNDKVGLLSARVTAAEGQVQTLQATVLAGGGGGSGGGGTDAAMLQLMLQGMEDRTKADIDLVRTDVDGVRRDVSELRDRVANVTDVLAKLDERTASKHDATDEENEQRKAEIEYLRNTVNDMKAEKEEEARRTTTTSATTSPAAPTALPWMTTTLVRDECRKAVIDMLGNVTATGTPGDTTSSLVTTSLAKIATLEDRVDKLNDSVVDLQLRSDVHDEGVPKTCAGYNKLGVTRSGQYDIDPDGSNYGLPPIRVTCNMHNGETQIGHDLLAPKEVEACEGVNCHNITLNYDSDMEQVRRLVELSLECRQDVKFECVKAPLTGYGFWVDSYGQPQSYFFGSNAGEAACACSFNNTCKFSPRGEKCNCDVLVGTAGWSFDAGTITNKSALPVTAFSYGYLAPSSQAKVSFGKLVCSGAGQLSDEGTSCSALKRQGEKNSGYFVLRKGNSIEKDLVVSYCDMGKEAFDPQIETSLGKIQLETTNCPETNPWSFDRGTKCCKDPLREDPASNTLCPVTADPAAPPLLRLMDPVGCCRGSEFVDCPDSAGGCASEEGQRFCPSTHPAAIWHGTKCCMSRQRDLTNCPNKNSANLTITDPVECCPGGQMVDCPDNGLCQTPVKVCFHKASMKMNHAEAKEYCETTPGYMPLLLKTKTELIDMATQFPGTGDIWIPFDPTPGNSMNDCDGLSCDGKYTWADGTVYDYNAPDAIRVVQNERDPCFRLMTGDEQINDNPCTNNFATVCAYHC